MNQGSRTNKIKFREPGGIRKIGREKREASEQIEYIAKKEFVIRYSLNKIEN